MSNGTVYQRRDGRWESRLSLGKDKDGKRKFRSFYGKNREEALHKLLTAQQGIEEEYAVTEMTVSELVHEWRSAMSSRLKESTAANYRMKAEKHLIPAFGSLQCCMLKAKAVYDFIDKKLKSGLSARYVADILVLLKSIFRYANREYHIRNMLSGILMPKCAKPEVQILSAEQQTDLKQYIAGNPSLTTLGVSLSLHMGLRIGELCALKWSDIDLEKRTLNVRRTIQRIQTPDDEKHTKVIVTKPKSANSIREIPIPNCLLPLLTACRNHKNIFVVSGKETPIEPRAMQYRFAKLLKNVGLPSVHFHSLRHAFATNCVALGFDVKTLSEILGHSSVEITLNRYVHSSMERKRTCMNLLSQAV